MIKKDYSKNSELFTSSENSDAKEIIKPLDLGSDMSKEAKWINNSGEEIEEVFGFNSNAELVNGRAAMFGFLMLILTELALQNQPVTRALFGIN